MIQYSSRRKFIQLSAIMGLSSGFLPAILLSQKKGNKEKSKDKGLVFLFQGDSITDGNRGRSNDPNHIMGHGYAYSVASRIGADFPDDRFTFYNRGISGNTVTDLQARWQTDTLALKPDVLSILVGINDVNAVVDHWPNEVSAATFETIYRQLLLEARQQNPDVLLVLGLPFVYAVGKRKDDFETWQIETDKRAGIIKKLAKEFNAVLVDYAAVINKAMIKTPTEYWVWDGIHPTVFAHELMARQWLKQVSSRLTFLKKYTK